MFKGRFEHSVDDKGRLAIPARFREHFSSTDDVSGLVITNFDRCLVAYSLGEWEKLEQKFCLLPQFDPKVVAFQRYFISGASECLIDKAGRILIPANLRATAGIDADCVVAGALNKLEIWSKDRWEREFIEISDQFSQLTGAMASFGISL